MSIRFAAAVLVIVCDVPHLISAQTAPRSEDAVAKRIAQLGDAYYRVREQAGRALVRIGGPALPALNRAARTSPLLETKRRIEILVERIEFNLLAVEAKNWQMLDSPYYVKDRLVQILTRKPDLSDDQIVAAVYLITVNRTPTKKETARALAKFAEANSRTIAALQIARPLIQSKEANADLIYSYLQVVNAAETPNFSDRYTRTNEAMTRFGTALSKAARTNANRADLAFLFVLSRFPRPREFGRGGSTSPDLSNAPAALKLVRALWDKAELMRLR
jgi:hypothetical protein